MNILTKAYTKWLLRGSSHREQDAKLHKYQERIKRVQEAGTFVVPPDTLLEEFCTQAAKACDAERGFVTLVYDDRQVIVADHGLSAEQREIDMTPDGMDISYSICQFVVAQESVLAIPDTVEEPMLKSCLSVPTIRAYMGAPIWYGGAAIGALGVSNGQPRYWTREQQAKLTELAALVTADILDRSRLLNS